MEVGATTELAALNENDDHDPNEDSDEDDSDTDSLHSDDIDIKKGHAVSVPTKYQSLVERLWHQDATRRPLVEEFLATLTKIERQRRNQKEENSNNNNKKMSTSIANQQVIDLCLSPQEDSVCGASFDDLSALCHHGSNEKRFFSV